MTRPDLPLVVAGPTAEDQLPEFASRNGSEMLPGLGDVFMLVRFRLVARPILQCFDGEPDQLLVSAPTNLLRCDGSPVSVETLSIRDFQITGSGEVCGLDVLERTVMIVVPTRVMLEGEGRNPGCRDQSRRGCCLLLGRLWRYQMQSHACAPCPCV